VMNLAVKHDAITLSEAMTAKLKEIRVQADKVLFRTLDTINYNQFEAQYSFIGTDLAEQLGALSFKLVGLDTPSVDHIDSKELETHHILEKHKLVWLENLDLTGAEEGFYQLLALPLKFLELEASPLRAVLLK
jgi:arylformamidase